MCFQSIIKIVKLHQIFKFFLSFKKYTLMNWNFEFAVPVLFNNLFFSLKIHLMKESIIKVRKNMLFLEHGDKKKLNFKCLF